MIVFVAEQAQADLIGIGDYIARDNPRRAQSFVAELLDRCRSLADKPHAFPLVPRFEHTQVRRRTHGADLVFYRVGVDRIDVLHILNGAKDYEAILFPKEQR